MSKNHSESRKYVIGVDFGSESGRAVIADVANGYELATSIHLYAKGVIDERLPGTNIELEADWALQDPNDYIEVFKHTIPAVLAESGVSPEDVIGVGIDFTACTMLPTNRDGVPLCFLPEYRDEPHAWVKLWKHHAAQPEADQINAVAAELGESWPVRYGGKISSEWFYSKALQILHEAPQIYQAADRLIEAADWVVWQLTGEETRNIGTAGYKAIWQKDSGFPSPEFFKALHPDMANIVETKMDASVLPLGSQAGKLSAQAAEWTGLKAGTTVAVANVDAHVTLPVTGNTEAGTLVMIMGTSTCHVLLGERLEEVPGMCGVVEDGIVPGMFGYEAGQSGVGDIFAWFVENGVPSAYQQEAEQTGLSVHTVLERHAAALKPGESGLLALDWWNGNRSTLVDADLGGLIVGLTLASTAPEIYRTLIEATAYGTREIIEAFTKSGVPVNAVVAAGGLPERNTLLMQIYADVINRDINLIGSSQAPALGAAMHAAVAAGESLGGYADIAKAAKYMGGLSEVIYRPNSANVPIYQELYQEYQRLYDYFGRGENNVMKRLRRIKSQVTASQPASDETVRTNKTVKQSALV